MRKILLFFILLVGVSLIGGCVNNNSDYLRIHIRANSNSEEDQNIKYFIKDIMVEYMEPLLQDVNSKEKAVQVFQENKENLIELIDGVLLESGFDYSCHIEINNEFFPTRSYDDIVLESGYYDALIVNLGSGNGNNWWCVMYPNLCFNQPNNVVYKSKILEIINKLKG